jgi:putative transposase
MSEPLEIRWSGSFEGTPSTVVVSKDSANRYFVSLLVEETIKPFKVSPNTIGIDLGLTNAVITSDGHKFGNPQFFRKDEQRLAKAQRNFAKKQKGSKNRDKARLKVAKVHARIQDRRNDFLHKLSTALIRENQVICAESLQVKNMLKNHNLAKAISDVGWGELVRQLKYKAEWHGRDFVQIDKFYPSSKRCHRCGRIIDSLPLSTRSWDCLECGTKHDRDINAAKNIKAAGLAVLACGEAIRPGRAKAKAKAQRGKPQRSRKSIGTSL